VVLFAIIPVSLLSLLNTIYFTLAGYELIRMSMTFLLFFYVSNNVKNMREVVLMMFALLFMTFLQSGYGILQHVIGLKIPFLAQFGETATVKENLGEFLSIARVGGTMGHPNVLAAFFVLMLPLALALILSELKFLYKAFLAFVLLAGTTTLILTLSRGGWMSFAIGALVIVFLASRSKVLHYGSNTFVLTTMIAVFVLIGIAFSGDIYLKITASQESSLVSRWELMKSAIAMIKDHPIVGVGVNSFSFVFPDYDHSGIPWGPWNPPVHNIYLLVWSETGTVGLASFIIIIIFLYRIGFRILKNTRDITTLCVTMGLMGSLTGAFIHFSVDWNFRTDPLQRTFYLLVGLLAAIDRLVKEKTDEKNAAAQEIQSNIKEEMVSCHK
jgi:O-antigen ligase